VKLSGFAVFPGLVTAEALVVRRAERAVPHRSITAAEVPAERDRLRAAVGRARAEVADLKARLSAEAGADHAYLFDAQIHMLDDPLLVGRAETLVAEKKLGSEWALSLVGDELRRLFARASSVVAERSHDLDDLIDRLLDHLGPEAPSAQGFVRLDRPVALVVEDLKPSQAASLDWSMVRALVADHGSPTHHMAIVARSRGIPSVLGVRTATAHIASGALIVVDGGAGLVSTNVEPGVFPAPAPGGAPAVSGLPAPPASPARTLDGTEVVLRANIEFSGDIEAVRTFGAMGVGLFRSEYLLRRHGSPPSEDEQVEVYRRIALGVAPHPLTVRTFDLAPEDLAPGGPSSPNPALGLRAFRLLSRGGGIFRTQIRALLRVADQTAIRILFPFVGGADDADEILTFVSEVEGEIHLEGRPFRRPPLGAMVEIPSAALAADTLGRRFDFLCVGTNDLIQYTLAIDRGDPRVAHLYAPFHEGFLRLLGAVAEGAQASSCPLSVCGEMAGEPEQARLLVGLGFRELSMSPYALPAVRAALEESRVSELEAAVSAARDARLSGTPADRFRARIARAGSPARATDARIDGASS
jgi:phosphotransferase system enzyme I (PtsI)